MSSQIVDRIQYLKDYLQYLISTNNPIQDSYTQNGKAVITSILDNYKGLNKKLSRKQTKLYNMLKSLQENLEKVVMIINENEEFTLWDWLAIRINYSAVTRLRISNKRVDSPIKKAIGICRAIENTLKHCFSQKNCIQSLYRYLLDDTVGTLDYMRIDLINRFKCEEICLFNGNVKIDW